MKKFRSQEHLRILALLKLVASARGIHVKDLAVENGISNTAIYNALYTSWPKGERILSKILDIEPQELWPSRYDLEGRRKFITGGDIDVKGKEKNGAAI